MLVLTRHVRTSVVPTHREWRAHGRACPCLEGVRYCSYWSCSYPSRAGRIYGRAFPCTFTAPHPWWCTPLPGESQVLLLPEMFIFTQGGS